jgi:uncharacterized BrkB/YihY/UPF0761 family membrane protein
VPKQDINEFELKVEQGKVLKGAIAAIVLATTVLAAVYFGPRLVEGKPDDLRSLLAFWAAMSLVPLLFILIGIGMVSHGRRNSAHDIVGAAYSAPSPRIAVAAAFLQNTLEQAVVAMASHLAVLLLVGASMMGLIAASVLLFAIGRVSFLRGYSRGAGARSFGMALTAVPTLFSFITAASSAIAWLWSSL